jgi:hypothetical protein
MLPRFLLSRVLASILLLILLTSARPVSGDFPPRIQSCLTDSPRASSDTNSVQGTLQPNPPVEHSTPFGPTIDLCTINGYLRGVTGSWEWCPTSLGASLQSVRPGDTVNFILSFKNCKSTSATRYVGGSVAGYPASGQYCGSGWVSTFLQPGQVASVTLSWTVPADVPVGGYGLRVAVWTSCTSGCANTPCHREGCCSGQIESFDASRLFFCRPNTPYFTHYNGSVRLNEQVAPVGTVVEAHSSRGQLAGFCSVTTEGLYGYMRTYGEDSTASPPISGMRAGEPVTFKVNGQCALPSPGPIFWWDDKQYHTIDLNSPCEQTQRISLHTGWNWFSIFNSPADKSIASVLSTISGKYDQVNGEAGIYKPPPANPIFNTLTQILPGEGYMIRMTQAAEEPNPLVVTGAFLPNNTPIPLDAGWNWIGFLPDSAQSVSCALSSVSGNYDLVLGEVGLYAPPPANPAFNTLSNLEPGRGYLIRTTWNVSLIYPVSAAVSIASAEPSHQVDDQYRTPYFTHYYGSVSAAGQAVPAGAIIQALNPRGNVVGSFRVTTPGAYGYMRVYGEDANASPPIPGMRAGEMVTFRIQGKPATATPSPIVWQDDKTVHEVSLSTNQSVQVELVFLPMLLK